MPGMIIAKLGMTNVHPWVYGHNTRVKHQKPIMGFYLQISSSAKGYNRGPRLFDEDAVASQRCTLVYFKETRHHFT